MMRPGIVDLDGVLLLPERAVFQPAAATLWVADVHLGKAAAYRAAGIPIPAGTTRENLLRLSSLIGAWNAGALVFLGDLIHARESHTASLHAELRDWRAQHAGVRMLLVRGNHDRSAGPPPADLGFEDAGEAHAVGGLCGRHEPLAFGGNARGEARGEAPGAAGGARGSAAPSTLAGHVHPTVRIRRGAHERLRLRCFLHEGSQLILPAFGEFTGGFDVSDRRGATAYLVAEDRVVPWAL